MPIVSTATNYMWKSLKIWKLWHPSRGPGVPIACRKNELALLRNVVRCVSEELLFKGALQAAALSMWAVARKPAGAVLQVALSLLHRCLQNQSTDPTLKVPGAMLPCHWKGSQKRPELRGILGAVVSAVSSYYVSHMLSELKHFCSCISQRWWTSLCVAAELLQPFLCTFCPPSHLCLFLPYVHMEMQSI